MAGEQGSDELESYVWPPDGKFSGVDGKPRLDPSFRRGTTERRRPGGTLAPSGLSGTQIPVSFALLTVSPPHGHLPGAAVKPKRLKTPLDAVDVDYHSNTTHIGIQSRFAIWQI